MSEAPGWKAVWKINVHFFKAMLGLGLGWASWQVSGPGFELFFIFAVLFAFAGVTQAVIGLIETIKLVLRQRKWARYHAQGAVPKADRMAGESKLRARGLMR